MCESNADIFEADKLQRLHIFHHLANILESMTSDTAALVGRTTQDDNLRALADEIRSAYLSDINNRVASARLDLQDASKAVAAVLGKRGSWWMEAVSELRALGLEGTFLERVKGGLRDAGPQGGAALADRFHTLDGFAFTLERELGALYTARDELLAAWSALDHAPTGAEVRASSMCEQCRPLQTGALCTHCEAEKVLTELERRLFSYRQRQVR